MSGSKLFFQLTAVGADDFIEDRSCVPPQAPPPFEAARLPPVQKRTLIPFETKKLRIKVESVQAVRVFEPLTQT